MKKMPLLIIFSFILMIKKVDDCHTIDTDNHCQKIGVNCKLNKPTCKKLHCKECNVCFNDVYCSTCKNNFQLDEIKHICFNKKTNTDTNNENTNENIECHENCFSCSLPFTNENMNCISCKENFYRLNGTNDCFDKTLLDDGFYLKNDIFYPCDDNCMTCSDEKNNENHNCIECAENYYKLPNRTHQNNCYDREEINVIYTQWTSLEEFQSQIKDNIMIYNNSSSLINGTDFIATILSSNNVEPKVQLDLGISAIDLGNCTQIIKEINNISENESLTIVNMESKRNTNKNDKENDNNENSFNIGKKVQIEIYDSSGNKLDLSVCKEDIKILQYIKDVNELNIPEAIKLADKGVDIFNANDDYFNDICHENIDGKDIIIKDRRNDIYKNVSFCQKGCIYNGIDYTYFAANCICNSSFLETNSAINITKDKNNKEKGLDFKTLKESIISSLFDFNLNVIYCYNLVFNLKILKNNIGFFCMAILLLLQIIFLIIYLVKKLQPLKNFMLIFSKINAKGVKSLIPPKKKENSIKTYINERNINDYVKINNHNNNPKNKNKDLLNIKSSFSKINKNKNNIIPKKENLVITNNFAPTINIQKPIINIKNNKIKTDSKKRKVNIKNKKVKKEKHNIMKSNSKMSLIKNRLIEKNKSSIKGKNSSFKTKFLNNLETLGNINKSINYDIVKLSRGDEDLLDMDYEQAIIFDKRAYLKMFWGILVDSQIILGTFFTENYLHLFIIKLSFLVFNFEISLFLNAFFYTDEYISNAYHNDGVLDFFTSLPKSIYSSLVTLVITSLLKMLSNSKNELTRVIRNKRKDNNYIFFVNNKLRKLRNKLIAYFILVILLDIIFLYYVSAFCAVYHYSQKYWFFGFLESFGFDTLTTIFICAIISLFRYISIKKKLKCFYIFANIISALF